MRCVPAKEEPWGKGVLARLEMRQKRWGNGTYPGTAERAGGESRGCSADGPRPVRRHKHGRVDTGEK